MNNNKNLDFYKSKDKRSYSTNKSSSLNSANKNNTRVFNNFGNKNYQDSDIKKRMLTGEQKMKKEMARKTLITAANAKGPIVAKAAEKALETKKGEQYLDTFASASSTAEGVKKVIKEITNDQKKKMKILTLAATFAPFLLLILFIVMLTNIFGGAKYSLDNEGTYESEDYQVDDPNVNYYLNFPGLYEKVHEVSKKVSNEYKVEIDRTLIISTLVSPIENGLIVPVEGDCGEPECYKFNSEFVTWDEFLKNWIEQVEFLAKAQIMTYIPKDSKEKVSCSPEETMEAYAQNDKERNEFGFLGWLNPVNWFKGFVDDKRAETNAKCIEAPNGETEVPIVRKLSIEQAEFFKKMGPNNELMLEKNPNSGGVYFWNLVQKDGFIHKYLKDYLDTTHADNVDKNYEINEMKIVDVVNEIYMHYDTTKITCGDYKVLESKIENIKVIEPGASSSYEVPFEDQYIGGVLLAEYNLGGLESRKAFAILARTEAVAVVGLDGEGEIENSSNNQNYNPNYSPEKYPLIAQAVKETRGMVLTKHFDPKIWHTEYDAFCPVKRDMDNGYYYLPDGQRNLPISPDAFQSKTGKNFSPPEEYLRCPCFQNNDSQPHDEIIGRKKIKYSFSPTEPNLEPAGEPPQATFNECWKPTEYRKDGKYGWQYKATGGHGRGASQYGLYYFEGFGYDWVALDRLFFDGAAIRLLSSSIETTTCPNAVLYKGEK